MVTWVMKIQQQQQAIQTNVHAHITANPKPWVVGRSCKMLTLLSFAQLSLQAPSSTTATFRETRRERQTERYNQHGQWAHGVCVRDRGSTELNLGLFPQKWNHEVIIYITKHYSTKQCGRAACRGKLK